MPQSNPQRLLDLEELTLQIPSQPDRQFFDEAVQCYFIGAFRASIILAWILATNNLMEKLERLAREDGEARKVWKNIEQKRDKGQSFEEDLINAFSNLKIYGDRDVAQLRYVRDIRNWCAHASEHQPTAEETRNCLRLVVDIVLSKYVYRGYSYINEILLNLQRPDYLPVRGYQTLIEEELRKLRQDLYPFLTDRVVELSQDPDISEQVLQNIERFLSGLIGHIKDDKLILKKVIEKLSTVAVNRPELVCNILSVAPDTFESFEEFRPQERLIRYLLEEINQRTRLHTDRESLLELLDAFLRTVFSVGKYIKEAKTQLEDYILDLPTLVRNHPDVLADIAFRRLLEELEQAKDTASRKLQEDQKPDQREARYLREEDEPHFSVGNATKFLIKADLASFENQSPGDKRIIIRDIFRTAIVGDVETGKAIQNISVWPNDWLELLVTEIPGVITQHNLTISRQNCDLITEPLTAWANQGGVLPQEWEALFVVTTPGTGVNWYLGDVEYLFVDFERIARAFKEKGNPSLLLDEFLSKIRPF